jgi:hypothetical protein
LRAGLLARDFAAGRPAAAPAPVPAVALAFDRGLAALRAVFAAFFVFTALFAPGPPLLLAFFFFLVATPDLRVNALSGRAKIIQFGD